MKKCFKCGQKAATTVGGRDYCSYCAQFAKEDS